MPRGSLESTAIRGSWCSTDYMVSMVKEFFIVLHLPFSLNWSLKVLPDTELMKAQVKLLKDVSKFMSFTELSN